MCTNNAGWGVEKRSHGINRNAVVSYGNFQKVKGKKRQCLLSYFYSLNLANILTLADVTECGGILPTEALPEKLAFNSNFLNSVFQWFFFLKKET